MNVNLNDFSLSTEATEKILRSMQEGLLVCNSEDNIQTVNDAALKILGFENETEIVGKPITVLFDSKDSAFGFLKHLEKENQLNHQELCLMKQGREITCSVSATTICDTQVGDKLKAIIFHDISERKETEQKLGDYASKLEKNNKELDQFAYIVSHDLKAPLRAIINLSQWLQEDLAADLSEESIKNLEMLKNRTFRMEALITGILEYSKIGRSKVPPELVDVEQLISEVLDSLLPQKHVNIEVGTMPIGMFPKIVLFQVFSNLISNAIKYNDKPEALIKINCNETVEEFEFTIQDNGPGIAREFYEKIFIIFQTLQSRDKIESTGVGLTIVKRLIEEQGGKIWLESEIGHGTTFSFLWPKSKTVN